MRIIGGSFKGRKFYPPADKWPTRPTTDYSKEGLFNIACAEMCGTSHYRMQGKLIVMEQEDFKEWLKEASTLAKDAVDRDNPSLFWGWKWEQNI